MTTYAERATAPDDFDEIFGPEPIESKADGALRDAVLREKDRIQVFVQASDRTVPADVIHATFNGSTQKFELTVRNADTTRALTTTTVGPFYQLEAEGLLMPDALVFAEMISGMVWSIESLQFFNERVGTVRVKMIVKTPDDEDGFVKMLKYQDLPSCSISVERLK